MGINKNWENGFNEDDYDDYKSAEVERERLEQANSTDWWIYIGLDIQRTNMAKIGLTSGDLGTRASSSQNPFFTLLCGFKVKDGIGPIKLKKIEDAVIAMLESRYVQINHFGTGRKSEWFYVSAHIMRELVHDFLYDQYSQYMYCYHCHERDMGVIHSWQNNGSINGGKNSRYHASDLSNPPVAFECLTPPGCGAADCDCW